MKFLRRNRTGTDIMDITPLVDVVFLLNIFFLLTSSYYLYSGIKIAVPQGAGEALGSPDVVVSVTLEGKVYIQNDPKALSVNELNRRMKKLRADKNDVTVLLRGDTDSRFGRMIEVYSACKAAGIENLRVHTRSMILPPVDRGGAEGTP